MDKTIPKLFEEIIWNLSFTDDSFPRVDDDGDLVIEGRSDTDCTFTDKTVRVRIHYDRITVTIDQGFHFSEVTDRDLLAINLLNLSMDGSEKLVVRRDGHIEYRCTLPRSARVTDVMNVLSKRFSCFNVRPTFRFDERGLLESNRTMEEIVEEYAVGDEGAGTCH